MMQDNFTSNIQKDQLRSYFYFYFPNKSKLVMQALAAGLSIKENYQDSVAVNKASMDFLISHMPIDSPLNCIDENKFLTEAALRMLNRKDFALGEKINTWLFEHMEEIDYDSEFEFDVLVNDNIDGVGADIVSEEDPAIVSIVLAIENMLEES